MFSLFTMRGGGAESRTPPASPAQSPPVASPQSENPDNDVLLDSLASLSKINGISIVQHGARIAVMGELLASVLTHLPAATRADIIESFRDRIENLMSLGDDRSLPQQYHSALLGEVNRYLNALR